MKSFRVAVAVAFLSATLACASVEQVEAAARDPQVQVDQGQLEGVRQPNRVDAFLGVPFAAAPVGPNRWRAPQPAVPWKGTRKAQSFGNSCWQPLTKAGFGPWTPEYVVQDQVSEDCLFLNIWRPSHRVDAKLPILVWIHGGGFGSGSGSVPIYNGQHLAERGVIVVTINYRVGVFGFLAHPEITREAGGAPPTNFGLQDMVAALRWIHDNIGAFGGDPAAVTIAGQSAGSMAVHALIASPMAKGLFRGAIAESGLPMEGLGTGDLASAEKAGVAFAAERGARTLAELRALPSERLSNEPGGQLPRFGPVVDGVLLPATITQLIVQGNASDVPMIVGQNTDEGTGLAGPSSGSTSDAWSDAQRTESMRDAQLDRGLASLWKWRSDRQEHGKAPIYAYLFGHVEPGPLAAQWKAFHSSEIPYVFNTLDASPERPFTAEDHQVALTVSSYWLNFVKAGDPNGTDAKGARLAKWPMFSTENPTILRIGSTAVAQPLMPADRLTAYREFIESGGVVSLF
jgi:para-nitrobenzyl esterase